MTVSVKNREINEYDIEHVILEQEEKGKILCKYFLHKKKRPMIADNLNAAGLLTVIEWAVRVGIPVEMRFYLANPACIRPGQKEGVA